MIKYQILQQRLSGRRYVILNEAVRGTVLSDLGMFLEMMMAWLFSPIGTDIFSGRQWAVYAWRLIASEMIVPVTVVKPRKRETTTAKYLLLV